MGSILKKDNVRIREEASDWEEAVRRAGQVLEESGSITGRYTESMIESVKNLGPYIVIMPGFALAHAAPSEAVLKSDIGLITLKEPVKFGSPNDPVSVVLCLACTDNTSHMEKLSGVAEILMKEDKIRQIREADSCEAVAGLFEVT